MDLIFAVLMQFSSLSLSLSLSLSPTGVRWWGDAYCKLVNVAITSISSTIRKRKWIHAGLSNYVILRHERESDVVCFLKNYNTSIKINILNYTRLV